MISVSELHVLDIRGLLALRALHDVEGNLLAFLQGLEAIHVDRGEVREEIFAAIVRSNEAKTFCVIEPFDGTECHVCYFPTKNEQITGLPDSLFELNDPVLMATSMQLESKHTGFLPRLNIVVNKFRWRSAA